MGNDIAKTGRFELSNSFEGWNDDVTGDDKPENTGLIQGTLIKFSNEGAWITRDGDELSKTLELIATGVVRVVQKWQDQKPVETIILEPGQPFPDIEELNASVPREEWEEDFNGNPRGPWQAQHILYLLDLSTMEKFTFPTATYGGRAAIRELRDKLVWMQRLRGVNVSPVVTLSEMFMNTRFGGRQRPFFKIVRWVQLGGEGEVAMQAVPGPTSPTMPPAAQASLPLSEVKEPSIEEDMNDAIPDFDEQAKAEGEKASKARSTERRKLASSAKKPVAKNSNARRKLSNLDAG
jgi:hypothetical protein